MIITVILLLLLMTSLEELGFIFLKEKSEVFSIFKKFKVLIENLSGERIKALRSDRVANIYQKSV
jgi:hypothetical protein